MTRYRVEENKLHITYDDGHVSMWVCSSEAHANLLKGLMEERENRSEEILRLEEEITDLNNTIGFLKRGIDEWKEKTENQAAEIERLKENNQRWRELLFKTAEKYVFDVFNADGDLILEKLEQALAAPPQKGDSDE